MTVSILCHIVILMYVIIFHCNKLSNTIGHKVLQLILIPLLTCAMHIISDERCFLKRDDWETSSSFKKHL
jgi:hypothetical protein